MATALSDSELVDLISQRLEEFSPLVTVINSDDAELAPNQVDVHLVLNRAPRSAQDAPNRDPVAIRTGLRW